METMQILEQAHNQEKVPDSWIVLPLLRQKMLLSILGWSFGILISILLLILMVPVMVPHNYQGGAGLAIFSTILLGIVLFVGLGSLWSLIFDAGRLQHPERHIIIITPDDFVKQEGNKIIHVPLEYVKHVTARGVPPVDRTVETARRENRPVGAMANIGSFFMGGRGSGQRGFGRRRMRTPTTLAFIDSRTDTEVVVVTDKAYGDSHAIGAYLKKYAASIQTIR